MYNLENLKKTLGNNQDTLKILLKVFFRTIPEQIKSINEAYQNKDIETINFIAHKLKTSFLTVGMLDLVNVIREIQENCDNKNFEIANDLFEKLNAVFIKELELLENEL